MMSLSLVYVYAQGTEQVLNLNLAHDCASAEQVLPSLKEQYGETPFAVGRASVTVAKENREVQGTLWMSVNPKSRTYTINILFEEDGIVCMLTSGDKFQPAFK
jgi:hypothetical protein